MNKELQDKIIYSLKYNSKDWDFDVFCANNKKLGIRLWITNRPYADLRVYEPFRSRRMKGWFIRRKVRKIIDDIQEKRLISRFK